jgi:heme/copper-type cytochrome/quinol oxidase subunit 1
VQFLSVDQYNQLFTMHGTIMLLFFATPIVFAFANFVVPLQIGLAISGLGTILGGVNMITTILTLRAPGMTMFPMPIFTWNILITSLLVIMVLCCCCVFRLVRCRRRGPAMRPGPGR